MDSKDALLLRCEITNINFNAGLYTNAQQTNKHNNQTRTNNQQTNSDTSRGFGSQVCTERTFTFWYSSRHRRTEVCVVFVYLWLLFACCVHLHSLCSDVQIVVADADPIAAHRCILAARSPVFKVCVYKQQSQTQTKNTNNQTGHVFASNA